MAHPIVTMKTLGQTTWSGLPQNYFGQPGNLNIYKTPMHYAELTGELSWIQKDTTAHYQRYPFLNIAHFSLYSLVDNNFKIKLATYYKNGIEQTLKRAGKNVFRNGAPFIWCSNNVLVDLVLQVMLYEKMTGDNKYHSYLLAMRDWLLGRNPWGTSMFMKYTCTRSLSKRCTHQQLGTGKT